MSSPESELRLVHHQSELSKRTVSSVWVARPARGKTNNKHTEPHLAGLLIGKRRTAFSQATFIFDLLGPEKNSPIPKSEWLGLARIRRKEWGWRSGGRKTTDYVQQPTSSLAYGLPVRFPDNDASFRCRPRSILSTAMNQKAWRSQECIRGTAKQRRQATYVRHGLAASGVPREALADAPITCRDRPGIRNRLRERIVHTSRTFTLISSRVSTRVDHDIACRIVCAAKVSQRLVVG